MTAQDPRAAVLEAHLAARHRTDPEDVASMAGDWQALVIRHGQDHEVGHFHLHPDLPGVFDGYRSALLDDPCEPPHLGSEWNALTGREQEQVRAWFREAEDAVATGSRAPRLLHGHLPVGTASRDHAECAACGRVPVLPGGAAGSECSLCGQRGFGRCGRSECPPENSSPAGPVPAAWPGGEAAP